MSTSNLCSVCRGACNVVTFSHGIQYWPCIGCGGAGVRVQHGPAVVVTHGRPARKRKARIPAGEAIPSERRSRWRRAMPQPVAPLRHTV